ncbi:hypothetical protein AB4851_28750 [Burkholderia sp. 22PA0099]|uniref:hypothetical protein n=1 Tax=Burkholderia sp. 22PA0099 TaxID=3237372 RepID=UPI0039C33DB9
MLTLGISELFFELLGTLDTPGGLVEAMEIAMEIVLRIADLLMTECGKQRCPVLKLAAVFHDLPVRVVLERASAKYNRPERGMASALQRIR